MHYFFRYLCTNIWTFIHDINSNKSENYCAIASSEGTRFFKNYFTVISKEVNEHEALSYLKSNIEIFTFKYFCFRSYCNNYSITEPIIETVKSHYNNLSEMLELWHEYMGNATSTAMTTLISSFFSISIL